jgi:hypothetical protein
MRYLVNLTFIIMISVISMPNTYCTIQDSNDELPLTHLDSLELSVFFHEKNPSFLSDISTSLDWIQNTSEKSWNWNTEIYRGD